jgi:hypothetical protein
MVDRNDVPVELTVEGPAAFAGALVDALQRHGVEVGPLDAPPEARTLDVDTVVTVSLAVAGNDTAIEAAVTEFVAEYPEAVVREANAGLG